MYQVALFGVLALLTLNQVGAAGLQNQSDTLFDLRVLQNADIGTLGEGEQHFFYEGQWYSKREARTRFYSVVSKKLVVPMTGDLSGYDVDAGKGKIPPVRGDRPFSVEVRFRVEPDSEDAWPAIWLMPVEHGKNKDTLIGGTPTWAEIDVHEGGFHPHTLLGSAHIWSSAVRRSAIRQVRCKWSGEAGSERHVKLVSVPERRRLVWYESGMECGDIYWPDLFDVLERQSLYIIISAQHHGRAVPYNLVITGLLITGSPSSHD